MGPQGCTRGSTEEGFGISDCCGGKTEDAVQGEIPEFTEIPLGLSSGTCGPLIRYAGRAETNPGEQALHETVALRQLFQYRNDPLVHQAEITRIIWDLRW